MGEMDNRGLAAERLHLVQLDGEFRHLKHWERKTRRKGKNEHDRTRRDLYDDKPLPSTNKGECTTDCEVRKRRPKDVWGVGSPRDGRPRIIPYDPQSNHILTLTEEERPLTATQRMLLVRERSEACSTGHKSKDCQHPHVRCARLSKGRCLVPPHHADYCLWPSSSLVSVPSGEHWRDHPAGGPRLEKWGNSEKDRATARTVCRDALGAAGC